MATDSNSRTCPRCRGEQLVDGAFRARSSTRFTPAGRFMWLGYQVRGFACLDCGFVGHTLNQEQIADLRRRLEEG
jgi:hypothetical protein